MLRDLRYRLRALFRRDAMERELDDELRFHLERAAEAHVQAGHSPEEARRLARLELGGVEAVKEECRDARGVRPLDDLIVDIKYGFRMLRRAPAFTAIAVLTLALGIGANTAMFSLVNATLRQPLPYPEPEQLVRLHASKPSCDRGSITYPNFVDWQAGNHTFAAMAVSRGGAFTLTGAGGSAERVSADLISADYFTVLGVRPIVGRTLAAGEDRPGADARVLLGEKLWRRRYGAAPDIVGASIVLDGTGFVVIGVMPAAPDLRSVSGGTPPDLYVPIGQVAPEALQRRGAGLGIHGIGRLEPGVTLAQARADMAAVTRHLAEVYPELRSTGSTIDPLRESVVGFVRPYVLLLFGAVGLVLLIACVNVANLLLARSAGRAREFGIRLALGASVGRLIRQLLTESLLLALLGGALGLLLAWWCAETLFVVLPRGLPHVGTVSIDTGLLLFTLAISIVAGVLSGLTPALKAARPDLHDTLKEGGRGPSATRYRAQAVFVILQVAMALVLLVGAGLLVRTLIGLARTDPGFERDNVITMGVSLSPSLREAEPARIRAELRHLESAIASTPGVASVTLTDATPIEADDQTHFVKDGQPTDSDRDMPWAMRFAVTPDYLSTMRIRLLRGRFFTPRDDERVPRVVVIDEVFARTHFPGVDPVGQRIRTSAYEFEPAEIVGVVRHIKQWGLDSDETTSVRVQMYEPFHQFPDELLPDLPNGLAVMVRTRGDPADTMRALRTTVQGLGADNVIYRVRSLDEVIERYQSTRRFSMYVLVAFAALALLLSCVGIYGVVSYVVDQRTPEIGVRMALGARPANILGMVLRQGAKLVITGVALGVVAAVGLSPLMAKLIYGVPTTDPVTFAAVAGAVIVLALSAIMLPARRAMRMQPMQALRTD